MKTRRGALAAICTATFMLLLDITIVQVALPDVRKDIGGGLTGLQWTVDAYAIALSSLVLAFGVIADRFGRRRVFVAGLVGFTLASAWCGAATSLVLLDVARAVQGIAGAALFATVLALIGQEFPGPERARAVAAWSATTGGAVACGPVVGGVLTEWVSWRAIFFVNVPIGVVAIALAMRHLDPGRAGSARRLDIAGVATFSAGLLLVVTGLLRGSATDWNSATPAVLTAVGALAVVAAGVLQRRPNAMVDLAVVRNRTFIGASLGLMALAAGMFAQLLYITLYLQNVRNYGPAAAGLLLLPLSGAAFIIPLLAQHAGVSMLSRWTLASGLALASAGLALQLTSRTDGFPAAFVIGLTVSGIGIGLANPSSVALGLAALPPERSGLAAGLSNTFRLSGLAIGVAVLGVAFRAGTTGGDVPTAVGGLHASLVTGVALTGAGALGALALVRRRTPDAVAAPTPVIAAVEAAG